MARFAESGLAGIEADLPRSGRKPRINAATIARLTTPSTPRGATYWSTRTLAAKPGSATAACLRIWRANGLKPHLVETFKVSRDPQFVEKLEDIVGLYLSPPEHTLVLCCDHRETPKDKALHLICDNYATHKHPKVREWLAKHPRFHVRFTPTSIHSAESHSRQSPLTFQ